MKAAKEEAAAKRKRLRYLRDHTELVLEDWNWREEHGYAIAEGKVTNISGMSLKNVEAIVTFKNESGEFITTGSALLEYNPILDGQSSPFKVYATWNPAMSKASISFKKLMGGVLTHVSRERMEELE